MHLTSAVSAESAVTGRQPVHVTCSTSNAKDRGPTVRSSSVHQQLVKPAMPLVSQQQQPLTPNETDVSLRARASEEDRVRTKFCDIYQVSENCDEFGVFDIDNVRDDFSVAGRLSEPHHVKFFEKIGASSFVLNTLRNGHKPLLTSDVPNYEKDNNRSFEQHSDFGVKEIWKLIEDKKVELVSKKPKIVNPLSVAVQPNKLRLILDCSFLNKFIAVPTFKMEDYKTALSFFDENGFLFSFDMKDGYHHLLIDPEFRDYLGFKFEWEGKIFYARYRVAPFGLRDIPFIFTKILRPLVSHWRRAGIKICLYLDDGFSSAPNRAKALSDSIHVRQDLRRAGIVWNVKKSVWVPVQSLEWVGFSWDSAKGIFSVKQKRVEKLKAFLSELIQLESCSARKLAAFTGQIISMLPVIGDISRLKSRNCQILVALAHSWDESLPLNEKIKSEFLFWQDNIDRLNVYQCFPREGPILVDLIEGDASSTGCGGILNDDKVAAKIFDDIERKQSSTYREISNIHFSLVSFLSNIKIRSVTFKTDSQSAAKICKIGSMNAVLQHFAEAIFEICFSNNIKLNVEWIPRSQNEKADAISRLADAIDVDDWKTSDSFFKILDKKWGPFSVDLFANFYNAKCSKFYSLFYSPRSHGVDAFAHNWAGENALMVPPIPLIPRTLYHARICKCKGTLIVPFWTSSSFWPVLLNDFQSNIKDWMQLKGGKVLEQGKNRNSIFGSNRFQGDVLALKMEF